MTKKINVAVLGATGLVGSQMLQILAERQCPIANLYPLASQRSAGKTVTFGDEALTVQAAEHFDWRQADVALFSAGGAASQRFAPMANAAGCCVIDNSSAFRYDDAVPLIVPEVNGEVLREQAHLLIANPNCSTIQMVVALKPIYDQVGITRINVCTYQAVSGSGWQGIHELQQQVTAQQAEQPPVCEQYSVPIAYNVIPHIDRFEDNGYTREEMKMVWETQKIFADPHIQVNPTAVRVPVLNGHSEAIHLETAEPCTPERVRGWLAAAPGVQLLSGDREYPSVVTEGDGSDPVWVGRIRQDISLPNGINLWVVADNVRKGAALNAVQILEQLLADASDPEEGSERELEYLADPTQTTHLPFASGQRSEGVLGRKPKKTPE